MLIGWLVWAVLSWQQGSMLAPGVGAGPLSEVGGHWEGRMTLTPGEYEIDFSLDLGAEPSGPLRGRIDYITQGTGAQDIDHLEVKGGEISFSTRDAEGTVTLFAGSLLADGSIGGDMSEGEHHALFTLHRAPPRQRPAVHLVNLGGQADKLRGQFNAEQADLRVLMIASPTCGGCRMGALLLQRYVLSRLADPRLRVYVIWEGIARRDTAAAAEDSCALLTDPRVTCFWSEKRIAGDIFKATVNSATPLWDVFLIYAPGRSWDGIVPVPDDFRHSRGRELPKEKTFNAIELAERLGRLNGGR